jgi:haloacetate dehalogenase
MLFDGFDRKQVATSGATINLVVGGSGPPLLLLHGYPETHAMWHRVAPELAREFTVVAADLRGYGDSSKPDGGADHAAYSKRAMAQDQIEVMQSLGFDRFAVAGHDRGARVAYRMAIDHPNVVSKLAVLDIVPTHWMYSNVNRLIATAYYHWFMLIQPFDLPERLIGADPEYYLRTSLDRWGGSGIGSFDPAVVDEYVRCFCTPEAIHATCEDYRAGATVDFQNDAAEAGKRRISCPTLVLCGRGLWRLGALDIWREWCTDVRGAGLECGHFLPEEAPDETLAALREFFLS